MKKTLILIALFTILANCEIKPREAQAQQTTKDLFYTGGRWGYHYMYHEETRQGMTYGIWSLSPASGTSVQTGYTVAVHNLTKEALEVELLKLQIGELHKKQNQP